MFILGGWHNTISAIARMNEHGADRKTRKDFKVEKGKKYHFRIERRGGHIDWQVDGKPFFTSTIPSRSTGRITPTSASTTGKPSCTSTTSRSRRCRGSRCARCRSSACASRWDAGMTTRDHPTTGVPVDAALDTDRAASDLSGADLTGVDGGGLCGAPGQACCAGACDHRRLLHRQRLRPSGNACGTNAVCANGTCAACGAAGQACCPNNTCAADVSSGIYGCCAPGTNTCVPAATPAAAASACATTGAAAPAAAPTSVLRHHATSLHRAGDRLRHLGQLRGLRQGRQSCCANGGCDGGGCCVAGICHANGTSCGQTMCVDGSCGGGTCGGLGQPCCNGDARREQPLRQRPLPRLRRQGRALLQRPEHRQLTWCAAPYKSQLVMSVCVCKP